MIKKYSTSWALENKIHSKEKKNISIIPAFMDLRAQDCGIIKV